MPATAASRHPSSTSLNACPSPASPIILCYSTLALTPQLSTIIPTEPSASGGCGPIDLHLYIAPSNPRTSRFLPWACSRHSPPPWYQSSKLPPTPAQVALADSFPATRSAYATSVDGMRIRHGFITPGEGRAVGDPGASSGSLAFMARPAGAGPSI